MARFVIAWMLTVVVVSTFGSAQCLAACLTRPCENHGSQKRPAGGRESSCPHSKTPTQKDKGTPQCHQLELSSDDWLQPSKLFDPIVNPAWAIVPAAAIQLPATAGSTPVNWVFLLSRQLQLPASLILRI